MISGKLFTASPVLRKNIGAEAPFFIDISAVLLHNL